MKRLQSLLGLVMIGAMLISFADAQEIQPSQQDTRKQLFISLEEAISIALQNNLEIRIEQYNPEIKREDINNAEAAFSTEVSAESAQVLNEPASVQSPKYITNLEKQAQFCDSICR